MIRFTSLRQRLMAFLILPVALLLVTMGLVGFIYARNSLLAQWREAAILKLQRAAHRVDMRLSRPKEWIQMYNRTAGAPDATALQQWIVEQLETLEGISLVRLKLQQEIDQAPSSRPRPPGEGGRRTGMSGCAMRFSRASVAEVTLPSYDTATEPETVVLGSNLLNEGGEVVGRLEVSVHFDYLVQDVVSSGAWQTMRGFLVDGEGTILAGTGEAKRERLYDNGEPLERLTLEAMKTEPYGTLMGKGHPPRLVSGFYRLEEAPWILVVLADGKEILGPIIRFRLIYFAASAAFILSILLLIHVTTGRTVTAVKEVSMAAERIAAGDYDVRLPVTGHDEVGRLTESFNSMAGQLKERLRLKEALDVAMEVQQNLLPHRPPDLEGLDIAGTSLYCDETGGDYFDYLDFSSISFPKVGIVVGDVSGHGIPSALLMATTRAFLRMRASLPGDMAQVVGDVNWELSRDLEGSGRFMTLFYLQVDRRRETLRWVRAGHDPALCYDPRAEAFEALEGPGMALGLATEAIYQECEKTGIAPGQILLLSTDGLWEACDARGQVLPREMVRQCIRQHRRETAEAILEAILRRLREFQRGAPPQDDVTLVVVKIVE